MMRIIFFFSIYAECVEDNTSNNKITHFILRAILAKMDIFSPTTKEIHFVLKM